MNTPVLNVRAGDQRRKQLLQRLAQQAAQRIGTAHSLTKSQVGRFGRMGTQTNASHQYGYGRPKGVGRPLGAGIGAHGGGSGLNFTDAYRSVLARGNAAPQAAQGLQRAEEQSPDVGIPAGGAGAVYQESGVANTPEQSAAQSAAANADPFVQQQLAAAGLTGVAPNTGQGFGGLGSGATSTFAPTGDIGLSSAASTLVPLGGGAYLDPATGQVHGGQEMPAFEQRYGGRLVS